MEDMTRGLELQTDRATAGLSRFASDVVALVLDRGSARPVVLDEALLDQFMRTVMAQDAAGLASLRAEFRRMHVTPAVLAEIYIPEAARRFGEAWLADSMTFCEVTLGSARLQAVLHELSSECFEPDLQGVTAGVVLLIVPAGEQHTLGGLTVAWQLRRRGVSVCLQIGPDLDKVRGLVRKSRFDGAFVSVASLRHLDGLGDLVRAIKSSDRHSLMVAIGGATAMDQFDRVAAAGADIVTCDLDEALGVMGVAAMRPKAGRF